MPTRLNWLFMVCFFLFSVAVMEGQQAVFEEQVTGTSEGGTNCQYITEKKLSISCDGHWDDGYAEGYELAVAENGFGDMKAYAYSSLTTIQSGVSEVNDEAFVQDDTQDELSIVGLSGQPIAFVKLTFECLECWAYSSANAVYDAFASTDDACSVPNPAGSPSCTITVQIVYDPNGQPYSFSLRRILQITAPTIVMNAPADETVTTTICIGYFAGGCGTIGATVKASVINAKDKVFKGVTVIGSSGHIYN
jgi:hypothetical protein